METENIPQAEDGKVTAPEVDTTTPEVVEQTPEVVEQAVPSPNEIVVGADGLRGDKGVWTVLSRTTSVVLHPFFMPLYGAVILLFSNALFVLTPLLGKLWFIGLIALYTVVIPWAGLALMRVLKVVSNMSVNEPKERIWPIIMLLGCYLASIIAMRSLPFATTVRGFLVAASLCIVGAAVITPFWKISLHMCGAGGMTALCLLLVMSGSRMAIVPLCISVAASGMLGSARLYLGSHNGAQAAAGYVYGFVITAVSLLFL